MAAVLVARAPGELRIPKRPVKAGAEATPGVRAEIGELRRLDQTIALLGWDEETMLPAAARAERGDQLASLEALRHNLLTSDRLGDLMEEAALETEGDPRWTRELALLRRSRRQALALPEELIRAFAQAKSRALGAWEEARAQDDFAVFAPAFETVLGQARERAQALAPGEELYDAALEDFEPGMTRARLDPVLGELRDRLAPLVRSSAEQSASSAPSPEGRMVPEAAQWELCRDLLAAIGFDFARGRLDRSTHPFTLLAGANDVRLTIRVHEDNVASTILTTLHEGGHALYDQGLTQGDRDCLLSDAPSMGLHECQARLWENHVGRLGAFWAHLLPALRARSGAAMDGLDADAFRRAVNRIRPSLIRVDADPVSYHLHIFMRYELEIALFSGALAVRDLPAAWRERSAALIGAAPACDREGVLQDVHWAQGLFGYFPSYTLGSLYAAQLVEAYERDHALADEIGRGDFASLRGWLAERVYAHGQLYSAEEVVLRATGKGLDAGAFLRHIERTADGPSGAGQTASRRGSPRR
ncbi:MAG: carboxypeptidase M32 [Alphaproteobacteria bacterium]|nr:carboxypeptidase M32 [Alphaproteobacteria bacterium]